MRHHLGQNLGQRVKASALGLFLAMSVVACAGYDIPFIEDVPGRGLVVADVPSREEVVRGEDDPPIVTLNLKSGLRERRLSATEEFKSDVIIPPTNLNAVPVTAALQAVLAGTDVSLSWNTAGSLGSRLVTVMNLSGPLPRVVDKICSGARIFCTYRHGSIEMSEKETFVVSIPPIVRSIGSASATGSASSSSSASSSTSNSIVEAINKLLDGEKATVDEHGGNIVYTATVDVEERVSRYLTELRTERPLIVLQMYIWEVTLDRENSQGINWSTFSKRFSNSTSLSLSNNLTSAATGAGSVSLGAVTSGVISASAIASFIATKGRVQTISNPQLTFVSGSTASLKIGGTQRYISEVGTNTSTNVSGTTGSAATSSNTNTVSTDSIETGLAVNVAGSYENGVVFANLDLSIKSLVDLGTTSSGGGTINLPVTADERMNTVLRVRPGDSLVLAGYVTSNNNAKRQGFPVGQDSSIPLYGNESHSNRELVIIVKPSIVLFSDREEDTEKNKNFEELLPTPVMVDKDGFRVLDRDTKAVYKPRAVPIKKTQAKQSATEGEGGEGQVDYRINDPLTRQQILQPDVEVSPLPETLPYRRRERSSSVQPVQNTWPTKSSSLDFEEADSPQPNFSNAFDKLLDSFGAGGSGEGSP